MRATRQLQATAKSAVHATAKSAARYLEANTPTGLTGLPTHPSPRPALLYAYSRTLRKLQELPRSSIYRQSCEALTTQRINILNDTKPAGYDEWLQRVKSTIDENPTAYGRLRREDGSIEYSEASIQQKISWDGKVTKKDALSPSGGTRQEAYEKSLRVANDVAQVNKVAEEGEIPTIFDLEVEPALTADQ